METVEDSGWKLVHGDVFRPPHDSDLFATVVGMGVQVLWTMVVVVALAAVGVLSPAYRGSILTMGVVLFVVMGFFAGYASARL